jgi:regulator of sirC expression with transglutaminase-like and TPR domain
MLRALIHRPEEQIDLAQAALCIAWEDTGTSSIDEALAQLEQMTADVRPLVHHSHDPQHVIPAINTYLFEDMGFRGNTWNYTDPENSFLDRVLARRIGLPIALSIIYLEIGWRLGLPMSGVSLPGHFLTRYTTPAGDIYIDPFHQGRIWSTAECARQVQRMYGKLNAPLMRTALRPPSRRGILVRLLRNLKQTYLAQENIPRALAASERIILLAPDEAAEIRDRGLLRIRTGQYHGALEDLETYAALAPTAADLPDMQQHAQVLADSLAFGN